MPSATTPTISFIIPVYNGGPSLERSLDSIRAQTSGDWEAIIVDDGSTDDSATRAQRYCDMDSRFCLIARENGGASAARNTALAVATGRFVVFVDADDWIAPDHLETLLPLVIDRDDRHLAYCSYVRVTADDVPMPPDWCPRLMTDPFELLAQACEPAIHCVVVPRTIVAEVGNFDEDLKTCEDWDLWQRLARAGVTFHGTERPLAFYRMRNGSLSTRYEHVERDAQIVLRRGAGADPRVTSPLPQFANGSQAAAAMLAFDERMFEAGKLAAAGHSHDGHLAASRFEDPNFDTRRAIEHFITGFAAQRSTPSDDIGDIADDILSTLLSPSSGDQSDAVIVSTVSEICLERDSLDRPLRFGSWLAHKIDLELPLQPIEPDKGAERLYLRVMMGEELLGIATLPIFGPVSASMIANAVIERMSVKDMARNRRLVFRAGTISGAVSGLWQMARQGLAGQIVGRQGFKRTKSGMARFLAASAVRRALATSKSSSSARDGRALALEIAQAAAQQAADAVPQITGDEILRADDEPDMADGRKEYWEQIFADADPWNYDNPYEAEKYEATLELVREKRVENALELACAEGHFSRRLASAVMSLHSTDISENALTRARKRCEDFDNVRFSQLDFFGQPIPQGYDLVVCSEVLYFAEDEAQLAHIAEKIAGALNPGGTLVTAHANVVSRDRDLSGFDWGDQFGVNQINAAFIKTGKLALERQIVTKLYRVSRFRRVDDAIQMPPPAIEHREIEATLDTELKRYIIFGGAPVLRADVAEERRWRVPLISFPPSEPSSIDAAISTERMADHLAFLRRHGYSSLRGAELVASKGGRKRASGRAVVILVDVIDPMSCETDLLPLFESYDFTAVLGIEADLILTADSTCLEKINSLARRGFELAVNYDQIRRWNSPVKNLQRLAQAKAILDKIAGQQPSIANLRQWPLDPVAPDIIASAGFDLRIGPAPGFLDLERDDWIMRRIAIDPDDSIGMLSEKLRYDYDA